jgi:hypothetical protein
MTVPSADYQCNGDGLCTGAAVVNVASSNGGASFEFSGTIDDASAALTIKIGGQPEVKVTRDASMNWHYSWAPVAGSGEVVVVATATDLVGNPASITRKVLVDVTPPACRFERTDHERLVDGTHPLPLLQCEEAMALSTVRGALTINGNPQPADFYGDTNNAFFSAKAKALYGNSTYALALAAGAVDRAGNPAAALSGIQFRTQPVLPAGETVVGKSLSGFDYPRMAVDVDGLPFVFVWDASGQGGSRARLFTWDGLGDGAAVGANPGQWIEVTMTTPPSSSFGPVRDFRIGQGPQLNSDLSLKHSGRVLLSPDPGPKEASVGAAYAESSDDFVTFSPRSLPFIDAKSHPSFYGGLSASQDASGIWKITESLADERVVVAKPWATAAQLQRWVRNAEKDWIQDTVFQPIGVLLGSMHQAGLIGQKCDASSQCPPPLRMWHASGADIDASTTNTEVVAAGAAPLPHGSNAPGYVAWSEHPLGSLHLTVACQDNVASNSWPTSSPIDISGNDVAGIDFGQGVSMVAIAVDAVTGQEHTSRFGLLPGDTCGKPISVAWSAAGDSVPGRNPTTAFSNDGVLWRVLVRGSDLRVLAPMSIR